MKSPHEPLQDALEALASRARTARAAVLATLAIPLDRALDAVHTYGSGRRRDWFFRREPDPSPAAVSHAAFERATCSRPGVLEDLEAPALEAGVVRLAKSPGVELRRWDPVYFSTVERSVLVAPGVSVSRDLWEALHRAAEDLKRGVVEPVRVRARPTPGYEQLHLSLVADPIDPQARIQERHDTLRLDTGTDAHPFWNRCTSDSVERTQLPARRGGEPDDPSRPAEPPVDTGLVDTDTKDSTVSSCETDAPDQV